MKDIVFVIVIAAAIAVAIYLVRDHKPFPTGDGGKLNLRPELWRLNDN